VYSFYANKTITTGEGGMVCTDRDAWAERIRLMRNHGINREAWNRYTTDSVTAGSARPHWWYEVTAAGFKYNMPDTAAAIGRVQLARAFSFLDRRREIARRYQEAFSTEAARELIRLPHFDRGHAWHLFIVRINAERSSVDRDGAIAALADRGIGTSVHYIPLHHMPYWRERYPDHAPLPVTDSCAEEIMSLPIYPDLRDEEQDRVVAAVRAVLGVPCGPD
jgi:dTDP-4-amino-4,6-dideoxygalactose transaminase